MGQFCCLGLAERCLAVAVVPAASTMSACYKLGACDWRPGRLHVRKCGTCQAAVPAASAVNA